MPRSFQKIAGVRAVIQTNDTYSYSTTPENFLNGKQCSFAFWIYYVPKDQTILSLHNTDNIIQVGGRNAQVGSTGNDLFVVIDDVTGSFQSGVFFTVNADIPANAWTCVLVSIDTATDTTQVYYNDSLKANFIQRVVVPNAILNAEADYIRRGFNSTFNTNERSISHVANIWFDDSFIDFSIEANRRKFITASGTPAFLGTNGQLPTGSIPKIFFTGRPNEWNAGINRGTTSDLTVNAPAVVSDQLPIQA